MNKKILVVEDSVITQKIIMDSLGKDFDIKMAKNIKEARSKIGNNGFDIFLFDIVLPDGNGFDFYEEIVQMGHNKCPIIFFSVERDRDKIIRGMELGQCDFIFKPFNPDELKVRIETQIAIYERRQKNVDYEKQLLTGEFGHEINNPVTSIVMALKKLKEEYKIYDSKYFETITRNVERIVIITKKYKEFYKDS